VVGERAVEQQLPQLLRAGAVAGQLHEPVEPRDHGEDLALLFHRGHAVEQGQRELGVLPGVGGHPVLAHPARLLAADRGGHQLVHQNAPRDQQRRFPPEVEGIAPRLAAQRVGSGERHPHHARRLGNHAAVGEVLQERRLPPRRPAIAAGVVGEKFGGRQQHAAVAAER
jgi:hypothetical protein